MSNHLTNDEIFLIVERGKKALSNNRFLHFENCDYCNSIYQKQLTVDRTLKHLKPINAPESISSKVIKTVERLAEKSIPKKKTDWVFLVAVIVLFGIGTWIIFSGKINQYIPQKVSDVVSEQKEVLQKNTYYENIKEKLPALEFNFKFPVENNILIIMIGIVATLFYFLIDRKLNQHFNFRKT